jgi:hypothetical protein
MNDIIQILAALDGAEIPGGCEDCDVYQTTSVDVYRIGHITVHHDDDCPWLNARESSNNPHEEKK